MHSWATRWKHRNPRFCDSPACTPNRLRTRPSTPARESRWVCSGHLPFGIPNRKPNDLHEHPDRHVPALGRRRKMNPPSDSHDHTPTHDPENRERRGEALRFPYNHHLPPDILVGSPIHAERKAPDTRFRALLRRRRLRQPLRSPGRNPNHDPENSRRRSEVSRPSRKLARFFGTLGGTSSRHRMSPGRRRKAPRHRGRLGRRSYSPNCTPTPFHSARREHSRVSRPERWLGSVL